MKFKVKATFTMPVCTVVDAADKEAAARLAFGRPFLVFHDRSDFINTEWAGALDADGNAMGGIDFRGDDPNNSVEVI